MNDLNAVRVFLALMRTKSTSRAAMSLGRSQSYVSKILSKLRAELSDPLFLRSADGLTPTSYAIALEPKLSVAFDQLILAFEPDSFSPRELDKVTLHIAEPYLVTKGKAIIKALQRETDAAIDLRTWTANSEKLILLEEVDLGVHVLNDKPQSFYQKRLHRGSGAFTGNVEGGQYVKFVVSGINEEKHLFHQLDPTIEPRLYVDNYQLMAQLMDDFYTLEYKKMTDEMSPDLSLDIALIMKSSLRYSPKVQWLCELVTPILNQD
ncbi:LysR family transcriptional regulator [Vibrio maerlii]|uniref:LysR family transcriptional regulator n=1 Tax=Vibrio maerlii TaxID=2231648 RepID=UPI000E3CDAC2|nr:LysR family transcriptional regulator [Vibrio maerlii]